ncbi:zinc finger BED domain-containing protein RICESLEEPER 2-like [Pistacia vera]|uniref:zinc finger BED domain-containing protein RICESLEEPER 2-like n=1 Tax=Pistacia vera TaxID=55513 RepID=UPI001263DBF1|nr:zinc finger BED domain-containing protein RICESLEEPER 2-like [Pistacia vera]
MNTQPNVTCLPNEDANVNLFQRRKRTKTSSVWAKYKEVVLPNEWEIEDKVQMISVDNATSNDVVEGFCRDCATIAFAVSKLIIDCKTRWNLTYDMLEIAIKFKEVFPRYKERDEGYEHFPNKEDWVKVEKVCEILRVFSTMTNIISGSNYPTSNVFLRQVCRIKILSDKKSESEDVFIRQMVRKMKEKCDKYWGQCNLLMYVVAIINPRYKMRVTEFSFPKMYFDVEARTNATTIQDALYEVYGEYANDCQSSSAVCRGTSERVGLGVIPEGSTGGGVDDWEFDDFLNEVETIEPNKSQLDIYLSEACYKCQGDSENFDALDWWKANALKYLILSRMARDILAIPITTVASEATFSVGNRVIDTYQSSLSPETVEMLLCGADWCRILNGVKKGITIQKEPLEIQFPEV